MISSETDEGVCDETNFFMDAFDPFAEYVPAGHVLQVDDDVAPVAAEYLPAAHFVQVPDE